MKFKLPAAVTGAAAAIALLAATPAAAGPAVPQPAAPQSAAATATAAAAAAAESARAAGNFLERWCAKEFNRTLTQHLDAITNRDLKKLEPTVGNSMVLIFPSGTIVRGKKGFMDFHRDWFADPLWRQPYSVTDKNIQGCSTAWVLVDYTFQRLDADGNVTTSSHNMFALTWTFDRGRWLAIADQNTKLPA